MTPTRPTAIDASLSLTAVLLLLRAPGPYYIRFVLAALAVITLAVPSARRDWLVWAIAAAAVAVAIALAFPLPDNHIYLLAWWCLALALGLSSTRAPEVICASARWLIGLAFLAAVVWKGVLSPDYLDGRFFAATLLIDDRFADAVVLVGGLSDAEVMSRRVLLLPALDGAQVSDAPSLLAPPAFARLAQALTWGGLALEAAVAATFLVGRLRRTALVLLLVFCASTYALAPVTGFGCLLLAMGLARCRDDERGLHVAFLAVFVLVLFYTEVPWAGLIRP